MGKTKRDIMTDPLLDKCHEHKLKRSEPTVCPNCRGSGHTCGDICTECEGEGVVYD